jgi:hypothetical protein
MKPRYILGWIVVALAIGLTKLVLSERPEEPASASGPVNYELLAPAMPEK